ERWETEFQEEVEEKFTLWAESPSNWVDAARRNTLTGMVRLAIGIYVQAGEVLSTVEWLRDGLRAYNTAIQMVDVDRLSTPPEEMANPDVQGGVESNLYGAPQAFHIRRAHPSDYLQPDLAYQWKRVPIRKPWGRLQVIHILEQSRPDQSRGIAEIVAGLKECRVTKKFRDIVLQNAVLNATFAASIESELPTESVFAALGAQDMQGAITTYASSYLGAIAEYAGKGRNLHIDGVKIPHLFPGTKLQLRPAGQGGPLGNEFEQSLLRYISALLGVSYEELSHDYTKTNYASGKLAKSNTGKFMQARKRMVADRYASYIYQLWLEEAINKRLITSLPRNAPAWYDGMNADAYAACDWIGANFGQIDELKETQAAVLRIKNGLSTVEEEVARLGKDWRAVYRQVKREKALRKELDIDDVVGLTQPDNMMNAATGAPSEANDGAGNA
ncbi:MAG TPA: phage portal protein, partial [Reyranella sp.]|nr:phage portal protein [Reyranella sp.]